MPVLTVRGAIPSDAAVLSALAQRSKAHWGYPPEWLEAWRPSLTLSAEYLVRHTVLVAESASSVVGFAAAAMAPSDCSRSVPTVTIRVTPATRACSTCSSPTPS